MCITKTQTNSPIDENQLVAHLRSQSKRCLKAQLYEDAIFFADKVLNLVKESGKMKNGSSHLDNIEN